MKKKTLNIIIATALLTSVFAISSSAIYISIKNKNNNNQDINSGTENNNTINKPSIDNNKPNNPDNNLTPPNNSDDKLPPSNNESDSNENTIHYVNELNKLVSYNQILSLKLNSKLKQIKPSEIKDEQLSIIEIDNFSFNDSVIDRNKLGFKIISKNDLKGTLTAKLKYDSYTSYSDLTINGFLSSNPSINDNTVVSDELIAQIIYENNRTIDISTYKNVSKTIPMFFRNEDEWNNFKSDSLKQYFKLPTYANWNKVSFEIYMDSNNEGILKMLVKYGDSTYNKPIYFTGFKKAKDWLNELAINNPKISLKNLNQFTPSQFSAQEDNSILVNDISNFNGKENVPNFRLMSNEVFQIIPTTYTNDDEGSLKAKCILWIDSSTKIEAEDTIIVDNFERKVSIAESFAKLNPVIDIKELMKNDKVNIYDQGYNFITRLNKIMSSQYDRVEGFINDAIYEIPWILKNDNIDITKSIIIDKKTNSIDDVWSFFKNITFKVDKSSIDDRYGTLDVYVKIKYSNNTYSSLESNLNKIKVKGLLDYSIIGIEFIELNPKLYVAPHSKLYNQDPRNVNYSDISLWSASGHEGDAEFYVRYAWWKNMMPKLKLVPVRNEKGEIIMPAQNDRLFAQVQIDGIDIKYPTSYRYIELIWKNRSNN